MTHKTMDICESGMTLQKQGLVKGRSWNAEGGKLIVKGTPLGKV